MPNDEYLMTKAQMTNYEISSSSRSGSRQPRRSCVKAGHSFVIFLMLGLSAFAASPPSAQEILESVRMLESRERLDLQGQLREKENVIPFRLSQTGPLVRYSFENPEETLQLRLGESGSRLDVVSDEGTETVPATKLDQKIRGTGITYEDLA